MKRQLMLAAFAHHGAMRIGDVLKLSCKHDMLVAEWEVFEASGLIVRFGTSRERLCDLNPAFPAAIKLKALILALEGVHPQEPRLKVADLETPGRVVEEHGPREIFGPWFQTAIILTVAASGGSIPKDLLYASLRSVQSKAGRTTNALSALQRRIIIDLADDIVRIHPAFPAAAELVAFAKEFVSLRPSFDLRGSYRVSETKKCNNKPSEADAPAQPKRRHSKRYDWPRLEAGYEARPGGIRIALDGTPLLFGTVARYRVLATLAVNGSVPLPDLLRETQVRSGTYASLVADGWLGRQAHAGGQRSRQSVSLAADLLARDLLIALLKRMSMNWPVATLPVLDHSPAANPKTVKLNRTFGSIVRSETLLTLKAFGHADGSMMQRALPRHDRQEIARALRMFESFGIVCQSGSEGNARQFSLDATWPAAAELDSYLKALLNNDGRYEARIRGAETLMTPLRLKMRRNAERRKERSEPNSADDRAEDASGYPSGGLDHST